jgi:hypothetical protein
MRNTEAVIRFVIVNRVTGVVPGISAGRYWRIKKLAVFIILMKLRDADNNGDISFTAMKSRDRLHGVDTKQAPASLFCSRELQGKLYTQHFNSGTHNCINTVIIIKLGCL